ncbi:hypothetical protein PPSIR1_04618 [Plesiocystis pacifica SIR-1]|uniref:Impact N-terminal domain-containing protein n=1 Tax=Plesiocystis pacifica SIR-1 TaxID=391625 RepID=A6FWP6_9BACT|nr:YigZ family protein [Plesiocystis pacifica]EDM81720.1 hypothetical protein PPSIR1_04618 [Plesiocystis pacifica SIR-1]
MAESYTTLTEPHELEIDKVKRSRFIGLASPCASPDEAKAFIEAARSRFHDARHHAFAWRIGESARASDDGEPHHSAGAPILRELEGRGLNHAVVVVVRYFGGVKLGTGGLVRAYGAAAAAVLDDAPRARVLARTPVKLRFDYAIASAVQRVLHRHGLEPAHADYAARVCLTLHLEAGRVDGLVSELRDASGGAAELEVLDPIAVPE